MKTISIATLCVFAAFAAAATDATKLEVTQADAKRIVEGVKKSNLRGALKTKEAVPNETTAILFAIVGWDSAYGQQKREPSRYRAFRVDDCWLVTTRSMVIGGQERAVIRSSDGAFLHVSTGVHLDR